MTYPCENCGARMTLKELKAHLAQAVCAPWINDARNAELKANPLLNQGILMRDIRELYGEDLIE